MLLSEAAFTALHPALARLDAAVPVYVSTPEALSRIAGFNVHRGCLALAIRPDPSPLPAILEQSRVLVVVEGVADPSNLGAIFRNTLALGGDGVLLSPTCCDPLYRKAVRTSMGATLRVPFVPLIDWPGGLTMLRDAGYTLAAMTPQSPSVTLEQLASERPRRLAVMLGTEGDGLTPSAAALADVRVRIPVVPMADSINVAVAAGIALYRLGAAARP